MGQRALYKMAGTAQRSGARTCQFEHRVPADISSRANGLGVVIEFAATATTSARIVSTVIARDRVRFSLGTTDAATAAARHGLALAHVLSVFQAIRTGPIALSHKATVALAGEVYRRFLDRHSDNPATPETWAAVKGLNRAVREGRIASSDTPVLNMPKVMELMPRRFWFELHRCRVLEL